MGDEEYDPEAADEYDPVTAQDDASSSSEDNDQAPLVPPLTNVARYFTVPSFTGRLGVALSAELAVTEIPDDSVWKAAGIPADVRLTHIGTRRVQNLSEVGLVLGEATLGEDLVLTVVPVSDDYNRDWWSGVKGTAQPVVEDEYDPASTMLRVDGIEQLRDSSDSDSRSDSGRPAKRRRRSSTPTPKKKGDRKPP
eukprot:Hpha_TRINITY_DN31844_c0_g1::TRINITY_DN31844_c0_g1_i1::g.29936::m.29936